jgi:hypothetical protein
MANDDNEVAVAQHIQRLINIKTALKATKTPVECNGFAVLMKDVAILQLEGDIIRMEKSLEPAPLSPVPKTNWNWSKTAAVLGGTLITNTAVVVSILEIVKAVADKS